MVEIVEKVFRAKVLRWLENAIVALAFANKKMHPIGPFNSNRSTQAH